MGDVGDVGDVTSGIVIHRAYDRDIMIIWRLSTGSDYVGRRGGDDITDELWKHWNL